MHETAYIQGKKRDDKDLQRATVKLWEKTKCYIAHLAINFKWVMGRFLEQKDFHIHSPFDERNVFDAERCQNEKQWFDGAAL